MAIDALAASGDFGTLKAFIASKSSPGGHRDLREELEQFFTRIFNRSTDGITVHDLDFTIVGVNTTLRGWYEGRPLVGRKCFEAYHGRSSPCENCPSMVTLRTGRPHVGVVPYQVAGCVRGDQELSVFPLHGDDGRMICVLEYVRDITCLAHDARIVENLKRRIQFQDQTLQEQETALAVLLRQGHGVEERAAAELATALEELVLPLVARLESRCAAGEAARDVALLRERLSDIVSARSGGLLRALRSLTGREQEVALLVRQGESSKAIATRLCVTQKAVEFHRTNIRRKLGAGRSEGSLRSLLLARSTP